MNLNLVFPLVVCEDINHGLAHVGVFTNRIQEQQFGLHKVKTDYAVKIVANIFKKIKVSLSAYFLTEEIVRHFDVKNVLKSLAICSKSFRKKPK